MNDIDKLKKAKNIIISSDANWLLKNEDVDIITIMYHKEGEKASCGTACCLGCLFLPAGLIYAIIGGNSAVKKQVNLHLTEGNITLSGDSNFIIKVYNLLKKSEIGNYVKENENLIKARKSKLISNILIAILIIFVLIILVNL